MMLHSLRSFAICWFYKRYEDEIWCALILFVRRFEWNAASKLAMSLWKLNHKINSILVRIGDHFKSASKA